MRSPKHWRDLTIKWNWTKKNRFDKKNNLERIEYYTTEVMLSFLKARFKVLTERKLKKTHTGWSGAMHLRMMALYDREVLKTVAIEDFKNAVHYGNNNSFSLCHYRRLLKMLVTPNLMNRWEWNLKQVWELFSLNHSLDFTWWWTHVVAPNGFFQKELRYHSWRWVVWLSPDYFDESYTTNTRSVTVLVFNQW